MTALNRTSGSRTISLATGVPVPIAVANRVCREDSRKTPAGEIVREPEAVYAVENVSEMSRLMVATGGLEPPTPAL